MSAIEWETNHQTNVLRHVDSVHGSALADEFPFGCDIVQHLAEALIEARNTAPESVVSKPSYKVTGDRMQTHRDADWQGWLDTLKEKAESMVEAGESEITAGKPGEAPIVEYKRAGVTVRQMPEDDHGILRLSIGGHPDAPFDTAYLVFRGDRGKCQSLLRRALKALEYADASGR